MNLRSLSACEASASCEASEACEAKAVIFKNINTGEFNLDSTFK